MLSMSEKHSYTILENLWYQRQDNWICQFRLLHKVLSKRLRLYVDKVQIVQDLDLHNRLKRMDFAIDMLKRTEDNAEFLNHVMLFYETCFPLCSIVNCHNVYMGIWKFSWICEIQRYSLKVNAWYGLMYNCIIGPFFSLKRHTCHLLRHIGKFHISTTQSFSFMTFFEQDGAPPHWGTIVYSSLNDYFTRWWIGWRGPILWSPRSHDIMPLDFFLWGFVKNTAYGRKVLNIDDLKARITFAIAAVDMLTHTWCEIDYCLDVLCVIKGIHVKVLW